MAKTLLLNVLLKILGIHLIILMKSIHSDVVNDDGDYNDIDDDDDNYDDTFL